jgi:hypothetical protein
MNSKWNAKPHSCFRPIWPDSIQLLIDCPFQRESILPQRIGWPGIVNLRNLLDVEWIREYNWLRSTMLLAGVIKKYIFRRNSPSNDLPEIYVSKNISKEMRNQHKTAFTRISKIVVLANDAPSNGKSNLPVTGSWQTQTRNASIVPLHPAFP